MNLIVRERLFENLNRLTHLMIYLDDSSDIGISIEQAKLAAKSDIPVLLRGETGTGKELFAHAIHSGGERKFNKFIRVNCAAIHPITLEAELFGQEIGSAQNGNFVLKQGLFEESENGTLFLDEISDLPLSAQKKLLYYLTRGHNLSVQVVIILLNYRFE